MEATWCSYIAARNQEWCTIATYAFGIAVASPAILQLLGASKDPVLLYLVYLAVLRVIPAMIYAKMLELHLPRDMDEDGGICDTLIPERQKMRGLYPLYAVDNTGIAFYRIYMSVAPFSPTPPPFASEFVFRVGMSHSHEYKIPIYPHLHAVIAWR
ncbi:hypothetical protein LshimejAT787_1303410 [Lyophyllum shimeji]|uniref:Uncharacterized protein n=1 Tax=Lyophyllum shimeji TaxID=47721 RepID=A0A9P3PV11_LYOSH|nr:hypothetical protein LshimejAT787_1303410 [Lyophyllum shimeji]